MILIDKTSSMCSTNIYMTLAIEIERKSQNAKNFLSFRQHEQIITG